jgi:glycolate oxidase iron-sulfur subunit
VLARLGFNAQVPAGQTCCGALHRHAGDTAGAEALLGQNRQAFCAQPLDALLVSASGCAAALREDGAGLPPVRELCEFLAAQDGWGTLAPAPLDAAIAVHEPCSQRNVLGGVKPVFDLLARIPGVRAQALAGNDQCCGGAGAYPLAQPDMAGKLRSDKMAAMRAAEYRYIVTANLGCALQLGAGAREAGLGAEILHPVTLLARQLGFKE